MTGETKSVCWRIALPVFLGRKALLNKNNFYEVPMGKFCHSRSLVVVYNSYNVEQVNKSEQFLYFYSVDDGGGFIHRL